MGKYYTVIGNAIYIYSTGSSELLDISTLPKELGLFTEQVQWKLSPWIAMSHTTTEQSIKEAEEILVVNGFLRILNDQATLERYFKNGDENLLTSSIETAVRELSYVHRRIENHLELKKVVSERDTLTNPNNVDNN